MSRKYFTANIIYTGVACAIALGSSSPSWATSASAHVAGLPRDKDVPTSVHPSQTLPANFLVAMMGEMGGMGGMGAAKPGGSMPPAGEMPMPGTESSSGMQDPMAAPSGMDMMGKMRGSMQQPKSMTNMAPSGTMPGFPGASHLYHIGATGFFLDHPQHIDLSTEQQANLNRVKEKTFLDRKSADRRIEDAEQVLWTLTAAESPESAKIEAKVQEIEKLRSDQRIAFIRAVGEAGKVLTTDQQAALLGTKPAAGKQPPTNNQPAPTGKPGAMPAMPGM